MNVIDVAGCGGDKSVGGRSPGCFFWVLHKRSIPEPDPQG